MTALLSSLLFALSTPGLTSDVEVPFHATEDALIVDAKVNGVPVSLMFDTGFSGAVAVGESVDIGPATGKMTLRDFVRESEAKTVNIKSLQLGSLDVQPKDEQAVLTEAAGYDSYGVHCDGILGFEPVKNFVTTIDFQHQRFVFHPKSYDISSWVPNNKTTFLAKLLPIGQGSLQMTTDLPNGNTMVLALDTGNSFFLTTHRDVLERVGLWKPDKSPKFTSLSEVASGAVENFELRVPTATIFGVPVSNSVWDVINMPSSSADADGTVGYQFLKNFNVTIDYDRRRVWLENWTGKATGDDKAETGISAGYSRSQQAVVVVRVSPDSPAAQAGIKEGDQLVAVNGADLGRFGIRKMRSLLDGPAGTTVKVSVVRGGLLKRIELQRKDLVN